MVCKHMQCHQQLCQPAWILTISWRGVPIAGGRALRRGTRRDIPIAQLSPGRRVPRPSSALGGGVFFCDGLSAGCVAAPDRRKGVQTEELFSWFEQLRRETEPEYQQLLERMRRAASDRDRSPVRARVRRPLALSGMSPERNPRRAPESSCLQLPV